MRWGAGDARGRRLTGLGGAHLMQASQQPFQKGLLTSGDGAFHVKLQRS
jgi:hypothetical protein